MGHSPYNIRECARTGPTDPDSINPHPPSLQCASVTKGSTCSQTSFVPTKNADGWCEITSKEVGPSARLASHAIPTTHPCAFPLSHHITLRTL